MRFLPVFLDLATGPVVLVGAGEMAHAKLRLLMAAGAHVRWYGGTAADLDGAKLTIDERARITLLSEDAREASFAGVIAVLCAGAGDMGHTVAERAKAAGIPINVMDELSYSTFIFPAVVDRGDVVVAIGTGGSAPVLARRLREAIEALLPARIGDLSALIGRWRKNIHAKLPEMPLKRRFWEQVVDGPIGAAVLEGRLSEAERALAAIDSPSDYVREASIGSVALVGAGPGDPDLLTVKALRALQDADLVLHDDLVSAEILNRVRRDAALTPVGRRRGQPGIGQDEINRLMIAGARAGKRVVRLKGGDPFIFGRGGEEIEALREAGVRYSVVPGITAAMGAAAENELPLTFRHEALRVAFLTAHRAEDVETIDWAGLADPQTTIVAYMGIASAEAMRAGLLAAGRDMTTPVGVFVRATRPDAASFVGHLQDLPALAEKAGEGPALLMIGDVVARSKPARGLSLARLARKFVVAA